MNIYICHTVYHLMICLCKAKHGDALVLVRDIPEVEKFRERIVKEALFSRIFVVDRSEKLGKILQGYSEIYLFNDYTTIGFELHKRRRKYHLLEDAYNYHRLVPYLSRNIREAVRKLPLWKRILVSVYNKFYGFPACLGRSRYCVDIEVNSLEGLLHDDCFPKYRACDRKRLLSELPPEKKERIFRVFTYKAIACREKSALILTQPLYQDHYVESAREQGEIYRRFVDRVKKQYKVYIKVHPRDRFDYSGWEVEILDRLVPMELYEMDGGVQFEIGFTHSSTALDYLSCVTEKEFFTVLK